MGRKHCGAVQAKKRELEYKLQPAKTAKNKRAKFLKHLKNFPNDSQAIAHLNTLKLVAPDLTKKGRKVLTRAEKREMEAA